ncbi:MAG: hypothetical protein U9R36_02830 [Elusimicrobiota bacterium]|nr:hypothetical protein [Elusimicrobiota bacterium]
MGLLRVLGYLINSLLLLVVIISAARIIMDSYAKDIMEIPVGPLVKELSDVIMEQGRKFLPIKEEKNLLIGIVIGLMIVILIIQAVII